MRQLVSTIDGRGHSTAGNMQWDSMKNILKNLAALFIGVIIAFIISEIILRIFNPIEFRVKGNKINLPYNKKYVISNPDNPKLDKVIIHTKNSLGFRGSEKPEIFKTVLSFIAVGGSTTECFYLSDNNDWVTLLGMKLSKEFNNIWVNNAGMDGHSTFGHNILLTDYLVNIQPNYIMYLVGCNDVGRSDLNTYDKKILQNENFSWKNWVINKSETAALALNIVRGYRAQRSQLGNNISTLQLGGKFRLARFEHVPFIDSGQIKEDIESHKLYLRSYRERLLILIKKTKQYNIEPILITQPTLLGEGLDDVTKVNLETIKLMHPLGGKAYWNILEQYNDVTRKIGKENNILVIDLARKMPKSSKYFYDAIHFTNEGAEKVSELLFEELKKQLYSTLSKARGSVQ